MKKNKAIALLLASVVAASTVPTAVFAQEAPVEDIIPFDTILPVQLNTTTKSTIFTGQRNRLLPIILTVTNNILNPGNIEFRVVNQNGGAISSTVTVAPGHTGTVLVPASLSGGTYQVQASAVSVSGVYSLAVNQGDNDSLLTVQLSPDTISTVASFSDVPAGSTLTITNSTFSPGSVLIQVVNTATGEVIFPVENELTRQGAFFEVQGNGSVEVDVSVGDFSVNAKTPPAGSTGIYFLSAEID